ncbi:MAG TPA: hypothetical protein VMB77_01415 [Syntrophales bacterium]|nr:hypothetical protein [Syntrophales bacterium]
MMNRLKTLLQNFNVLNLALSAILCLVAGLVLYLHYGPDTGLTASGTSESVKVPAVPAPAGADGPDMQNFAVVAEKNLFHPERKIPPEIKEEALQKPDVILYGTLITENMRIAYLEDKKAPYSTAGRGQRQLTLKKGEKVSGYTLQEIEEDRITLVKGDDKIVVRLESPDKRKSGDATARPAAAAAAGRPGDRPPPPPSVVPTPQPSTSPRPSVTAPAAPTVPFPSRRPSVTGRNPGLQPAP